MSNNNWGKLVRADGGTDHVIPEIVLLFDKKNFFGRIPNADTRKFSHSQQIVIPLPTLSSTHFCIETKQSEDQAVTSFSLTDYSRNGTFFRRQANLPDSTASSIETMDDSKKVEIFNGDQIILMFCHKITLVYTFIENVKTKPSNQDVQVTTVDPSKRCDESNSMTNATVSNSSRKRSKDEDISHDDVRNAVAGDGGASGRLIRQQLTSLQQENKAQERRLAAAVANNSNLSVDLNSRERELRSAQSALALRDTEVNSLTDSLRATEANAAATEARVRILEDSSEVSSLSCFRQQLSALNKCSIEIDNSNFL